jgi:hypothetical protein
VVEPQKISPRWAGEPCVVVAPGPSLTHEVAQKVRLKRWIGKWNVIAVADAYRIVPCADVIYGCDTAWWDIHKRCGDTFGERWSCHEQHLRAADGVHGNDKRAAADAYELNLVVGRDGDEFSFDPTFIRYGSNAGFQAINLALLFGCTRIVLVGFDMRHVDGKAHFFGSHPDGLRRTDDSGYRGFVRHFERAAKALPSHVSIVNTTPESALTCFPMMDLDAAFSSISESDRLLHWDRNEPYAAAG